MKKLTFFLILSACLNAYSQEGKLSKEGDYFYQNRAYYEAIAAYTFALKANPTNVESRYRLALSYFYIRNYHHAHTEFLKLISLIQDDKELTQEYSFAWYYQGVVLKGLGEYQKAKESFMKFIKTKSYREEIREYKKLANNEVRSCNFAIEQIENQYFESFVVEKLEGVAHSGYSEFSPRFFSDNSLIFSSLYSDTLRKKIPGTEQAPLVKLFISQLKKNQAMDIEEFLDFNDDFFHTANGSFSPDRKTFFFTRCSENRSGANICAIYRSNRIGKNWTRPEKLKSDINLPGYSSTQPYFGAVKFGNKSFDALYFASDRPGGRGSFDIWFAEINGRDFEKSVNCGSMINSPGNEICPYYNSGEKTIYFSSDYWWGMGGYDVFRSEGYRKSWKRPENMGLPINSSYDDTYYSYEEKLHKGLFSSNRPGGKTIEGETCCEDIYVVKENKTDELLGVVKDADSKNLVLPETSVGFSVKKDNLPGDTTWILQTDEKGMFTFVRELRSSYTLILEKQDYQIASFDLDSVLRHKPDSGIYVFYLKKIMEDTIEIVPAVSTEELLAQANREIFTDQITEKEVFAGDVFILDDLHFDFNKSYMKEDFFRELDALLHLLTSNPEIKIEISGHTDARGSDEYNLQLSQRRAEVVKQYLIEKGIDEERMIAIGHGEKMPIATNDTEKGRRLNRRTEFKIL